MGVRCPRPRAPSYRLCSRCATIPDRRFHSTPAADAGYRRRGTAAGSPPSASPPPIHHCAARLLLLLKVSELPHHASGQPACCRLQESIERGVMGLKGKSTGDDLGKASFREFPFKDGRI